MNKKCKICNITKELTEFHPSGQYKDKIYYRGECRECNKSEQKKTSSGVCKKYRQSEHGKKKIKAYKQSEPGLSANRKYEFNKRQRDPLYRCKKLLRDRTRLFLKRRTLINKTKSFSEYIGCDNNTFIKYIESLFKPEMTWDNQVLWDLDHKIPLHNAKTEEDLYKLCHYTNLQPLWREEHKEKSKKDFQDYMNSKKSS